MKYLARTLALAFLAIAVVGCGGGAKIEPLVTTDLAAAFAGSSSAAKSSVDAAISAMESGDGMKATEALIEAAKDSTVSEAELDAMFDATAMIQKWVASGGSDAASSGPIMEATDVLTEALNRVAATR